LTTRFRSPDLALGDLLEPGKHAAAVVFQRQADRHHQLGVLDLELRSWTASSVVVDLETCS
jgi:hypothetical protein